MAPWRKRYHSSILVGFGAQGVCCNVFLDTILLNVQVIAYIHELD